MGKESPVRQEKMARGRDMTIDVMKGLGILAVIAGHLVETGRGFIFSWHMPLFFILAGYFYSEREPLAEARKDARRLLLPYALTCAALVAMAAAVSVIKGRDYVTDSLLAAAYASGSMGHTSRYMAWVPSVGVVWFLWALFWCKALYNILYRRLRGKALPACVALSVAAVALDSFVVNLPLAILPGASATVFYAVGHWLRGHGGFAGLRPAVAAVCLLAWGVALRETDMSMVRCHYGCYPLNVIGACGGVYAIYLLSLLLVRRMAAAGRALAWVGRCSLAVMCLHLVDLRSPLYGIVSMPAGARLLCGVAFCLLGAWAMSRFAVTRRAFGIISSP